MTPKDNLTIEGTKDERRAEIQNQKNLTESIEHSDVASIRQCIDPSAGELLPNYLRNWVTDHEGVIFEDHMLACLVCREEFLKSSGLAAEVEEYVDAFFDHENELKNAKLEENKRAKAKFKVVGGSEI
jgi:hypothetical protein